MIKDITEKVKQGIRLNYEEGLYLFSDVPLFTLGQLASLAKERQTQKKVYFINNLHINHTNVCVSRCQLCAFSRDLTDASAYTLAIDQIVDKALTEKDVSEIHLVGGLHPDLGIGYYEEMLSRLREALPSVHLQAFTAVEIDHIARVSKLSIKETLERLIKAGLGSLPGGGAEIFDPQIRSRIASKKISGHEWCSVMETAHHLGLNSNATMLYGHLENYAHRVDHLLQLRFLQDRTGGFKSFIPLPFHPENTMLAHLSSTGAVDDLRTLAVSRLLLDNFVYIKAFWIMLTTKLAQISLYFGVNDLDGTVRQEKIAHCAGSKTKEYLPCNEITALIKEAGFVPVERDTVYRELRIY